MKRPATRTPGNGRSSRRHRRSASEKTLSVTIREPEDPKVAESAARRFVEGMAQLATELILEGAFDMEPDGTPGRARHRRKGD